MKKLLVILFVILLTGMNVGAVDWVEPIFEMSGSYYFSGVVQEHDNPVYQNGALPENIVRFDFVGGLKFFNVLLFETEILTYNMFLDPNPVGGSFSPFQTDYGFRAAITQWVFSIGYEHWCYHPVKAGETFMEKFGGRDTIFLEVQIARKGGVVKGSGGIKVANNFVDNFLLYNPNNEEYVYYETASILISLNFGIDVKDDLFWLDVDGAVGGRMEQSPGGITFFKPFRDDTETTWFYSATVAAGFGFQGFRLGYEHTFSSKGYIGPENWLGSSTGRIILEYSLNRGRSLKK